MANEPAAPLDESVKAKGLAAIRDLAGLIDLKKAALYPSGGPPLRMCHYTDFADLKGIIETSSIWATYARTLNDSSEYRFGQETLTEYARKKAPPNAHRLVAEVLKVPQRNFVTCFCDGSHVLSMACLLRVWRRVLFGVRRSQPAGLRIPAL
jgi:hypothetical protein